MEERGWYKVLQAEGIDEKEIMFVIMFMSYPDSPASKSEVAKVIRSLESIKKLSNHARIQPILNKLTARHERMQ